MNLTPREKEAWQSYLDSLTPVQQPDASTVYAGFAGDALTTDALLALYLSGRKTAGSSILEDFVTAGDAPPRVGDHWIALDSERIPRCILRTTRVELHPFADVPTSVAIAEGEGDLSIEYWRATHATIYSPRAAQWGLRDIADATVLTEHFNIVWTAPGNPGPQT